MLIKWQIYTRCKSKSQPWHCANRNESAWSYKFFFKKQQAKFIQIRYEVTGWANMITSECERLFLRNLSLPVLYSRAIPKKYLQYNMYALKWPKTCLFNIVYINIYFNIFHIHWLNKWIFFKNFMCVFLHIFAERKDSLNKIFMGFLVCKSQWTCRGHLDSCRVS